MTIIAWFLLILSFLGILTAIGAKIFLKNIPAKPPYVGLITIKGERRPVFGKHIKREGWRFFADFFPFFYGFIPIKVEKVNQDIVLENVRCRLGDQDQEQAPRSGGEISIKIGLTWQSDYYHGNGSRLNSFIDSGGEENVKRIISDLVEEDVRQMGAERTWEEITFATDELAGNLIRKLTGEEPAQGESLMDLKRRMQANGFPDIADLGVVIWRFNVGKVKEQGKLAEAAEMQAKEIQERRGELFELGTDLQQAQTLQKAYKDAEEEKSLEDCLMEVRRRRAIREGHGQVFDVTGLPKNIKIG